ncbi:MAG: ABC-type branched-subunit amino acid transport system substrate-binding protein [Candidatus Binatia bacterium]
MTPLITVNRFPTIRAIGARPTGRAALLAALLFAGSVEAGGAAEIELTPLQERGKQIYTSGTSPNKNKLKALIGNPSIEVAASLMACVNCHGETGLGNPEGGVVPSNLQWAELTKPYTLEARKGRLRGPYSVSRLKLAIAMGTDSSGNELEAAMPRYRMSPEDMDALIDYLKVLGTDHDDGISENSVTIGVVLAPTRQLRSMHDSVRAIIDAAFAPINAEGGIFGRRIEVRFFNAPADPARRGPFYKALLDDQKLFALLSCFTVGAEKEADELTRSKKIPMLDAQTLFPDVSYPLNRYIFHLAPGIEGEAIALLQHLQGMTAAGSKRVAIVYPDRDQLAAVAAALAKRAANSVGPKIVKLPISSARMNVSSIAAELGKTKVDAVLLLGFSPQIAELAQRLEAWPEPPAILLPISQVPRDVFRLPAAFDRRIFVSFSRLPVPTNRAAREQFQRMAREYRIPAGNKSAQFAALSACHLLIDGLRAAGSEPSREKLIQHLEKRHRFETGFTEPMTFSPNRRIGANGAFILSVDLKNRTFLPPDKWIEITP